MIKLNKAHFIAWEFLKNNTDYRKEYTLKASLPQRTSKKFFHYFSKQHPTDILAGKWGLFAYQDPKRKLEASSPFWSISPTLEAEITPKGPPAFLPILHKSEVQISGLLLLDGYLIIKVENEKGAVQMRIRNGGSFDETSGLSLRLPVDLDLHISLTNGWELWQIAGSRLLKKIFDMAE